MSNEILFLSGFLVFIVIILLLDLGLFSKKDGPVSLKQAGLMSFFIVLLSMGFYVLLTYYGHLIHNIDSIERLQEIVAKHKHPIQINPSNFEHSLLLYDKNLGLEFLTGYLVEYALSVDKRSWCGAEKLPQSLVLGNFWSHCDAFSVYIYWCSTHSEV